jgi:hypothetical protein
MRKLLTTLVAVLLTASVFAQAPEKMNYQAVIRNSNGNLVTNTPVGMRISIQKKIFGMPPSYQNVYVETHNVVTNTNGLVTITIGNGAVVMGSIADIDWSDGEYYIKTETDPTGGTNYTITGGSQLLSVPYALHAKNVRKYKVGDFAQGGIVFWVDETGQHGLVCAKEDQSTGIRWHNATNRYTGTTGDGLYAGAMNTALIVATQIADNQTGNFAAKVCADYSVTVGRVTYGDWYLPSYLELMKLYEKRALIGNFSEDEYWSSTEVSDEAAKAVKFSTGSSGQAGKSLGFAVRAIRRF